MNTYPSLPADFLKTVSTTLSRVKRELQHDYEEAYPALREIIHLVLDEEEIRARNLTPFPHLIFPDLVEAHIAALNLQPVEIHHHEVTRSREVSQFATYQPALA